MRSPRPGRPSPGIRPRPERRFSITYPARQQFELHRIIGCHDLRVNGYTIRYDDQPVMAVGIMEFRDDKVVHERIYFGDPWEPPAWRARSVERFDPREQDSSVSAHQPREHRSAVRLSHGAKIERWREHKAPKSCPLDQLK